MNTRILITGGQGFIGRYLAAHWLEEDQQALVMCLGRSGRMDDRFTHRVNRGDISVPAPLPADLCAALSTNRYRYTALDLLDSPALKQLNKEFRPTVVIHLAGALRDDPPDRLFRTNVEATVSLIESVVGSGISQPLMIFGSSGGVYGTPAEDDLPLVETGTGQPVDLYSASKLAAEHVSRILCQRYRLPAIWARIFNVVGPGQEERHFCGRVAAQAAAIAAGVMNSVLEVGTLDTTRDFIDVRDVARALTCLAEKGTPGDVYNLASGEETPIERVLRDTLRLAGLEGRVDIRTLPGRPADIPRHFGSIQRIRALGYSPRHPLAGSLQDVLDYYRHDVRSAARRSSEAGPEDRRSLEVCVSAKHTCPVAIEPGLMAELPRRLINRFPCARMVVLTDTRVGGLYAEDLAQRMESAGINTGLVILPEGEASKTFEQFHRLIAELHDLDFDRRAVLVNVGGGVVTDTGGFVAATYMRGVAYVNVPTTLLAQHDAAVGGKVAVNTDWAKNFCGAFHQPCAVFADPCVLSSLEDREISAGVAEAIKVAITGEPALFELLERSSRSIRAERDPEVLARMLRLAVSRKIALLQPDPYEVDLRRVLNLGHTFGHPLETELTYCGIRHGEAVGFGIAVATEVATARGVCEGMAARRILQLLKTYDLPPHVPRSRLMAACRRLREIRLVRGGKLLFVLPTGISSVQIVDEVGDDEILAAIERLAVDPLLACCVEG